MKRTLTPLLQMTASLLLAVACSVSAQDKKQDPTGTWTWSFTGQNGQARTTTLKLKLDGEKLTGAVAGRNGETAIESATLKGDQIAFQVTREVNGNKFTTKYAGKLSGDSIKGKAETERNGEAQSRDWEAKRGEPKKE